MKDEYLCFIKFVGQDIDGNNTYEFLFTNEPDTFWGENFEYMPCCLCNDLKPNEEQYDLIKTIKTSIKLSLITESCCHSMQDTMDGVVSLAYEDMSDYDEYPEDGRLVLNYGMTLKETEEALSNKSIRFE